MDIPLEVAQLMERDAFYTRYRWTPRDLELLDAWDAHHLPLVWAARAEMQRRQSQNRPETADPRLMELLRG